MKSTPPPSRNALARPADLRSMGEVTLGTGDTITVKLRSGDVQLWRRVAGSVWFERVVP